MKSRMLLLALPLAALSCTSIAPVKVNAGEQCFRCRRVIADPQVAGEIVNGSLATKYRGPGCLAKYLAAHPDETGAVFVTDFTTGKMFPAANGVYVPVVVDPNTGEKDYRAFKNAADAATAADARLHAAPVDWTTVLAQAR
jgi:hypothetical protein